MDNFINIKLKCNFLYLILTDMILIIFKMIIKNINKNLPIPI